MRFLDIIFLLNILKEFCSNVIANDSNLKYFTFKRIVKFPELIKLLTKSTEANDKGMHAIFPEFGVRVEAISCAKIKNCDIHKKIIKLRQI